MKRTTSLTAALGLLADFGIKPDWFLRTVLAGPLLRHIATMSALALNDIQQSRLRWNEIEAGLHPWIRLLIDELQKYPKVDQGIESLVIFAVNKSDNHVTKRWVEQAAASHILGWKLTGYLESPPDTQDLTQGHSLTAGNWIIDRFMKTYCTDWSSSSRELEFLYISNKSAVSNIAQLPEWILDQRAVSALSLRASGLSCHSTRMPKVLGGMHKQEYFEKIITFLLQGELEHAFHLARTAKFANPLDRDIRSSLAFCAIPFDPSLAISELQDVPESDFAERHVSSSNLICAYVSAGQYSRARRLLTELRSQLAASPDEPEPSAWLWQPAALSRGEHVIVCCTPSVWAEKAQVVLENTEQCPDFTTGR